MKLKELREKFRQIDILKMRIKDQEHCALRIGTSERLKQHILNLKQELETLENEEI